MNSSFSRRDVIRSAAQTTVLAALAGPFTAFAAASVDAARLLYGFAPGGPVDSLSRRITEQLGSGYAKSAIVEYRSGVGGRLAADALVASPFDGSVMMHGPVGIFTFRPHIEKFSFDPLNDVLPVTLTCGFADALAVGPMVPASVTNIAEFLDWCRANPRLASFGSPGVGTPMHLIGQVLSRDSGVALTHVPYRQGAVQDLLGGQLPAYIAIESIFLPFVGDGRLRVLATSGAARSLGYPNVLTFVEQGHKNMVVRDWWAVFVPAKTPVDTVRRLAEEVHAVLKHPDSQKLLVSNGLQPVSSTPAELGELMKRDSQHWAEVIRATGFAATS